MKLFIFVFVGAFTGAFTNHIALKMLFRPLREYRIFGLRVPFTPGLIPSRINEIINSLARTVENHIIGADDIAKLIEKAGFREEIAMFVWRIVDEKLGGLLPGEILYSLKVWLSRKLIEYAESFMESAVRNMSGKAHISDYIKEKLADLNMLEIENIILGVAGRELGYITYLGGVLGGIIGLLNYLFMVYM